MTSQIQPDADKGSKALNTIAKFMLLAIAAMGAGMFGGLALVIGGFGYLGGAGAIAFAPGAALAGAGVAAFGVSMAGIKITAQRNAPHIDVYSKQQELEKQQKEQRGAAELAAARQKKLDKKAAKEFNSEAAVQLGSDIKTMRVLKLNVKTRQQPQVNK